MSQVEAKGGMWETRLFRTALMMATMLIAASPAQSAVSLASAEFAGIVLPEGAPAMLYDHGWTDAAWGKLVVSPEPDMGVVSQTSDESAAPITVAALLPEPLSWATILIGLAIIGWLVRGSRGRAPVSFV